MKNKYSRKNKANPFNTYIIEQFRIKNKLSTEEFCSSCNISQEDYDKFLHNDLDINIEVIFKIAKRMNTDILNLYCPDTPIF